MRDDLLNYLQFVLTGELAPVNVPPCAMYLDALLGGQELWSGDTPKYGDKFIAAVAIEGFPAESYPNILAGLESLPISFRFSSRFLFLDSFESMGLLRSYRRKWKQWTRGFFAQVFRTEGGPVNEDAALMAAQAERAMADASSNLVAFGYYTAVLVLMGEERDDLLENARAIAKELRREGFSSRVETINALEAWLGSLPGHAAPNVRRPLIHSLNLADLMPASSTWPGLAACPSPLFPPRFAAASLWRNDRLHPFPAQSSCLGRRPYARVRADRRRQIDASRADRGAVPALSERARHGLRQGPLAVHARARRPRRALRSRRRHGKPGAVPAGAA